MATYEIKITDTYYVFNDDFSNAVLNVTLLQKSDIASFFADGHTLQNLPAPIANLAESASFFNDESANLFLESAPTLHYVTLKESAGLFEDSINNQTLLAPIIYLAESASFFNDIDKPTMDMTGTPPEIVEITPIGNIYSQYPTFHVKCKSSIQPFIDFQLRDFADKILIRIDNAKMSFVEDLGNGLKIYDFELDLNISRYEYDFLLFGNYKIYAKCYNDLGYNVDYQTFSILEDETRLSIKAIEKQYEKDRLKVTFEISNRNESWVSIFPLLTNGRYQKALSVIDVEGENIYNVKNKYFIVKTKPTSTEYIVYMRFDTETEFTKLANSLQQKIIKIAVQCLVEDINGNEYDLTEFLQSLSYNYSTELASRQANISFIFNKILSPYTNQDTPLFYGNKIVIKTFLTVNEEEKEFIEYIGYIKSVETNNKSISVVALDKLSKFAQKLNEDLHYAPNKIMVSEPLKTLDGIKFKSSHAGWAQLPAPKIYVNGKMLKSGEYTIDYYRGEVYLSVNPYLDPEWVDQIVNMDDVPDRQTIDLLGTINLSSDVKVKWTYMEKVDYSCVNGVNSEQVWIEKTVNLIPKVDYNVDYEDRKLILTNPIPKDTLTMKDHYITISYRKDVDPVTAEYYYFEQGTNEVEQITKDLAERLGFVEEDLVDYFTEELVSKDGFNFMTKYKTVTEVTEFLVDGKPFDDYDIIGGNIQTNKALPSAEVIVDPMISTYFFTGMENVNISLDCDNAYFEKASIKLIFPNSNNNWASKTYGSDNIGLNLSAYKEVALMLRTNKDTNITILLLANDGTYISSATKNIQEGSWQRLIVDLSDVDVSLKREIGYLRIITEEACVVWVDYLHIPSHEVKISYKYSTLQPTGISINEVWYNKGDTDTYMDILEDLYKHVDPSYMLYIDKQEKLRGEYKKLLPYYIMPIIHQQTHLTGDTCFGGIVIPDYHIPILSEFNHSISEEQLYSAVMVIGKLSEKANSALIGSADDVCDVVAGVPYVRTTYYVPKSSAYTKDKVLYELLKAQGLDPVAPTNRDASAVIDGNTESGVYWYVKKENDASRAFSSDQLMLIITLPEPVKWEEINVSVGIFKNYVIREELYIEVETAEGEKFYPEEDNPTKKQGQSGTWLKWQNKRFKNKKIKRVYVYCSESARWITSTQVVGGGKK